MKSLTIELVIVFRKLKSHALSLIYVSIAETLAWNFIHGI